MKNFSGSIVVLVTTISPAKAKRNDCLYIFAPLQKWFSIPPGQVDPSAEGKVFAFLKRSGAKAGLVFAKWNEVKQGRTGAQRSVKIGELFPGKRVGVFNL